MPALNPSHATLWTPPEGWVRIRTIDAHTAGEPLRIITEGFPRLEGRSILDQRQFLSTKLDHLRTAVMWEPRGHREMYGCLIVPPVTSTAHFGVLFMHNEGYSTMCGHGVIAVATVAVSTDLLEPKSETDDIRMDTPAGLVSARVCRDEKAITSIEFENVPSFVADMDEKVNVPGIGTIRYDLAFGGAFYAFVDANQLGFECVPRESKALIETGMAIKRAVSEQRDMLHPVEPALGFLYGTIFVRNLGRQDVHSRNVCVFADGQVDRSPTGTGVSARLAIHLAKKEIGLNDTITVESIIGTRFTGAIARRTSIGTTEAVVPRIGGTAYITGRHEFLIDPSDPLRHGFLVE